MSLRWYYRPSWRSTADDPSVEFTDSVRLYTLDVSEYAEEGSTATSTVLVEDPTGALDFPPLTRLWATESAISASSNTFVYSGYIADRTIHRGDSTLTGSARVWEVNVVDENSILSRRVLSSASANRPAETDVARVQWLANEADGQALIDSTEFLSTASPIAMDAVDYRGQTGLDVLNDCAEASGKNFFAYYKEGTGVGIWYGVEDLAVHNSMVRLSNVLADIDNNTTFAMAEDTKLNRDPSRLVSGLYYQFSSGATYQRNHAMFQRIGLRDAPMSSFNVKTLAKAEARAQRLLADLDTESDRIETAVWLPAAKVNWIKAGMRLQFKASHLPGYEDFVWLRVLRRGVAQVSEEFYKLTLELGTNSIPAETAAGTFPAAAILYHPKNFGGGGIMPDIRWEGSGDDPPPGCAAVPLVGSMEYVTDGVGGVTAPYRGVRALGSGSLTVTFKADDVAGVTGSVTCTPAIRVNGVNVATSPHSDSGGLRTHSASWDFMTTVSVSAGDVIEAWFNSSWGNSMTVPSGAGINDLHLIVSGNLT